MVSSILMEIQKEKLDKRTLTPFPNLPKCICLYVQNYGIEESWLPNSIGNTVFCSIINESAVEGNSTNVGSDNVVGTDHTVREESTVQKYSESKVSDKIENNVPVSIDTFASSNPGTEMDEFSNAVQKLRVS